MTNPQHNALSTALLLWRGQPTWNPTPNWCITKHYLSKRSLGSPHWTPAYLPAHPNAISSTISCLDCLRALLYQGDNHLKEKHKTRRGMLNRAETFHIIPVSGPICILHNTAPEARVPTLSNVMIWTTSSHPSRTHCQTTFIWMICLDAMKKGLNPLSHIEGSHQPTISTPPGWAPESLRELEQIKVLFLMNNGKKVKHWIVMTEVIASCWQISLHQHLLSHRLLIHQTSDHQREAPVFLP